MKVAIIPDSAMILLNQVNKSNHEVLSNYNKMHLEKQNKETIEDYKKDVNKSSKHSIKEMPNLKPVRGIKYCGTESPSGVLGRMSIIGPIIDEADAVIMLSGRAKNHMYNTLNELILLGGGSGCLNTKLLIESSIRKREIPYLKLDYPNNSQEIIDMIDEINCFLDYLTDLEEGKTNEDYVKKHEKIKTDEQISHDDVERLLNKN